MPSDVRTTTPSRLNKSGPKKLTKGPCMAEPSAGIWDSEMMASEKPPLFRMTATMTAMMPSSMTMPWMKSFMTVAMYPPSTT